MVRFGDEDRASGLQEKAEASAQRGASQPKAFSAASVLREKLVSSFFRNCGLDMLGRSGSLRVAPIPMAAIAPGEGGGRSFRKTGGARWLISNAVASQNVVLAKNAKVVMKDDDPAAAGRPSVAMHSRTIAATDPDYVDSKTLAADIDAVAAELKQLLSGVEADSNNAALANSASVARAERDGDEEEGTVMPLHKRLLEYRYVRKIEAHLPPLEPLEDLGPRPVRKVDKIEQNVTAERLHWLQTRRARLEEQSRQREEKARKAAERREKLAETLELTLSESQAHWEYRARQGSPTSEARFILLKERADLRESRIEEARRRRIEKQASREQKIMSHLAETEMAALHAIQAKGHKSPGLQKSPRGLQGSSELLDVEELLEEPPPEVVVTVPPIHLPGLSEEADEPDTGLDFFGLQVEPTSQPPSPKKTSSKKEVQAGAEYS